MYKTYHSISVPYTFDPNRPNAKYTLDGVHFMNAGQFLQIQLIANLYNRIDRPDNKNFSEDSDIPELCESVKSSKATLVNTFLGNDTETHLQNFFAKVASTQFSWLILIDETIVRYVMDKKEFETFVRNWSKFDESRKVIRFKTTSTKMIQWLESNL